MEHAESAAAHKTVRVYIAQLALELEGADAALRHDAIIDAEQHLSAAILAGATADVAITEYGTPAEIARAYMDADSTHRSWRSAPTATEHHTVATPTRRHLHEIPVFGAWFDRRAWGAIAYFGAVGFILSIGYFIWSVTIGSLVIGLAPIVIGIPLLVLLLGSARALCLFEGKVVQLFLGVRMPQRTQPIQGADHVGFWQRIWCWLRDVRSWLSLGYLLGNFPVSLVLFVIIAVLTASSAVLMSLPFMHFAGAPIAQVDLDSGVNIQAFGETMPDENGEVRLPLIVSIGLGVVGFLMFTGTLWTARGFGWMYGHVVQAIQVARPQAVNPPRIQ
jgi:uncharacterized membrane protein